MQDRAEHDCWCNGQIGFNPFHTHNMTAGQQINTGSRPPPFFPLRLPWKTKLKFSPLCSAYTLKHRAVGRRNRLMLDALGWRMTRNTQRREE